MKVTATALDTINGDKQYYITIQEGENKVHIRCGENNYNKVKEMVDGTTNQTKLFEETKKEEKPAPKK